MIILRLLQNHIEKNQAQFFVGLIRTSLKFKIKQMLHIKISKKYMIDFNRLQLPYFQNNEYMKQTNLTYNILMIVGVGSILLTFGLILYDVHTKKNKKDETKKKKTDTIRLCLTGGPCGGKSEGINMLYNSLKKITVPVFIVPEAATIIGSAGLNLDLSKFTPREIQLFQIYLMRLQLNLENLMTKVGKNFMHQNKKSVILCDRGLLDGKAYAGDENWAKMLDQIKISQEQILQRYEAVIHMVTAAEGAAQHYNLGNAVRHQSVDFAVQLDRKIQRCYKNHPNRYLITNQFVVSNFQQKKNVLLVQVYQILLKLIQQNNVVGYYQDYMRKMKEGAEQNMDMKINPYLLRKIKFKQFMKKESGNKLQQMRKVSF